MTYTSGESKDKYSVVIPTLQKVWSTTKVLINTILKDENVGELILINNCGSSINLVNEKLKIVNLQENIYVNPAWNLGVSLAKFDNIALVNDDILFPNNTFGKFGNLEEYGILGWSNQKGNFKVTPATERNYNFGVFMVFKKSRYKVIPNELKIWCGDDWLFKNNKNNYTFNLDIETEESQTSNLAEFSNQKQLDLITYARL